MRVSGRRYRDEWLPNFYPSREVVEGRWLRISRTGKTVVLTPEEDAQLDEISMDAALFERLERTGHILTPGNSARVFEEVQLWQQHTYAGPGLHIVVLTRRCNLHCTYCHMNPLPVQADRSQFDLTLEVARRTVSFALDSPNPEISFEFQGGEPFLNFPGMVDFIHEARRQNQHVGKRLNFAVVTNLMVAKDEHLDFCRDNGVRVSYTLNGPQHIHDHYRRTRQGLGSYSRVVDRLREIQDRYPGLVTSTPLCVIDMYSASMLKELIDFFHDGGFAGVALIRLKPLGHARHGGLGLDIHAFIQRYLEALDYIIDRNRSSARVFVERMLPVLLGKILGRSDVQFMDWRNPCGDVSTALIYDHDGEILPSDEARSLRAEFSLGNVRDLTYSELMRRKETFRTMNLSLRDRDSTCRECPYNPYCHTSPVLDYARTGDPTPRPHQSEECLLTLAVLDWVFKRMLTDPLSLIRMLGTSDARLYELLRGSPDPQSGKGA